MPFAQEPSLICKTPLAVRASGAADDRLGLQAADGRVRRRESTLFQDFQHEMEAFRGEDPSEVVFVQAWRERVEAFAEQ
jgi:hypothetical protein